MAAILHTVREDETFMSICLSYGLNYEGMCKLNIRFLQMDPMDLVNVQPGEVIVIGDSADPMDLVRVLRRKGEL